MIYTLTLNPSLDYVITLDSLEIGRTNRAEKEMIFPGGKGINVSIVLTNLGFKNKAFGFQAGFTGEALAGMVKKAGVDASFIKLNHGNTRINVKLRGIPETEVNGQGPHLRPEEIQELINSLDCMTKEDILVISGAIPSHMPQSIYSEILQQVGHKAGKIIVDATNDLLLETLKYHPFLIKPNIHELEELAEMKLNSMDEVKEAAARLQVMGARNILVSMGKDGAFLLDENGECYYSKAPEGKLVNSVGAGDSMVAGFLAGYLESGNYEKAFYMSLCTGSASAFSEELAKRTEVVELLKQFNI